MSESEKKVIEQERVSVVASLRSSVNSGKRGACVAVLQVAYLSHTRTLHV